MLTGGFYYFIDHWFLSLKLGLRYKRVSPNLSTHVKVKTIYFTDLIHCDIKTSKSLGKIITFTHHELNYYYDGALFQPLSFNSALAYDKIVDNLSEGYEDNTDISEKRDLYGKCQILIKLRPFLSLMLEECKHPFYIFQVFSIILWCVEYYWIYAIAIFVLTVFSLISSCYQSWKSIHDLHDLALRSVQINVKRSGIWKMVDSTDLVPGDLIEIPRGVEMPCDAVLISGGAVVEESSLTGESVPVLKDSLPYLDDKTYNVELDRHFSLYEGTKILQTRTRDGGEVLGIVMRIGFSTMKGKMVRSILFPKPHQFKFTSDSLKFIGMLAFVSLIGFIVSVYLFIEQGVEAGQGVVLSLDLITIAVPPALPACMNIGTGFALHRLKKQGIFCISYPRINVAGKIDVYCFDKTGTLTEDGMNLLGVRVVHKQKMSELCENQESISKNRRRFLTCLAACHSLTNVDNELVGDTQDLEIFRFTGFNYQDSSNEEGIKAVVRNYSDKTNQKSDENNQKSDENSDVGVMHIFYFTSKLKRMGVITKDLNGEGLEFYMKGAPEVILERCKESSIPEDILQVLDNYTRSGYRVLACAMNRLNETPMSEIKSQKLEELEQTMTFLGLIVLQNKLKPKTIPTIKLLEKAKIKTIMSTGDAILTAVCVAKECGITDPKKTVFMGEIMNDEIVWEKMASSLDQQAREDPLNEPPWENQTDENYSLAITGAVLAAYDFKAKRDNIEAMIAIKHLVRKCRIYARMSPENKTLLIGHIQECGLIVGMCGDGANDCGALKSADIGISLTESETSIAAPFTSSIPDISCVIIVLKEGRCALSTSVECFKFMAVYSMIQFVSVQILYILDSGLTNNQFLADDLLVVLPLAMTMGAAGPYYKLSKKQPTSNLIGVKVISSVVGQSILQTIAMVIVYEIALSLPYFEPIDYEEGEEATDFFISDANTIIWLMSLMQLHTIAIVFNIGKPFKIPGYKNISFVIYLSLLLLLHIYLVLWPPQWLMDLYNIKDFPFYMRWILLGIWLVYSVLAFLYDRWVVDWIVKLLDLTIKDKKKIQDSFDVMNSKDKMIEA